MSVSDRGWYKTLAWAAVLGYMGIIFYLSAKPSVPIPALFPHQDKVFHFAEYLGLAFLAAHATGRGLFRRRFWIALGIAAVYGLSDEIHQSFVPGRDASVADWLADTVGAWVGAYLYLKSEDILLRPRRP